MLHIIKLSYMAYQFIYLTKSGMTFYGKYNQYTIYATQSCTPFISIYDPMKTVYYIWQ